MIAASLGVVVRRKAHWLRRRATALPLATASLLALLLLIPATSATITRHPPRAAPPVAAVVTKSAGPAARHIPSWTAEAWTHLATVETAIADLNARLDWLRTPVGDDHPARAARPASTPPLDTQAAQQQAAAQLDDALHAEYGFYVATVQNQDQHRAVLAAAAGQVPAVRDAVAYDIQAVAGQLAQEAAIAAAQKAIPNSRAPTPTKLLAPMRGVITQPFGPSDLTLEPSLTFAGVTYSHFHTGIDIAAALDTPVVAAAVGVVALAGPDTDPQGHVVGYGNFVVIAHAGGLITLYAHLDHVLVQPGQVVRAGDPIGLEGSSGSSTGPHLHFEVRLHGLLADPMTYLGQALRSA